jgi:hypothetical protein
VTIDIRSIDGATWIGLYLAGVFLMVAFVVCVDLVMNRGRYGDNR